VETSATRNAESGFTIVEVVVALTILVIALVGSALLFENGIIVSGNTRQRVVAAQLATSALERIRGTAADPTKWPSIPQGQTLFPQTVNGSQFVVTQDVQFVAQRSAQSSCDSPGTGSGEIMQVTETVTWIGMAGTKPVQQTTTLAPPVGAYSSATGSIAVKIFNAAGTTSPNINVQVSGPVTQTQQTTTEGCAFFYALTPGTYTVSVIEGTGVGDQEVVTPSQSTSVTVGQTASLQFNYDSAATITVSGNTGSTAQPASGMTYSVVDTGLQPYGQFSFGANGTPASLTPLFPYAAGYTVFAGSCTDSNPLGHDGAGNLFYPTLAPTPIDVPPGGSASTTVPLYTLQLLVKNSSGVIQTNATSTMTATTGFSRPYVSVCTSGTANAAGPVLGLVATDATGTSTTAVPLGHWTITTRAGTKSATTNVWVKPDAVYTVSSTGAAVSAVSGALNVTVH
jgi:prepilin-type N-terminal cleavage/methylation domain-containing protein